MKWTLQSQKTATDGKLLQEILFKNRSISKSEQKKFLNPPRPDQLTKKDHGISAKELDTGKKLLISAIQENKKIVVFGDYDADGICATAILWQTLYYLHKKNQKESGAIPIPFIPHREKHGYGLSITALAEIIEQYDPDLIITVDNGIVAFEAAEYLAQKKVSLIITDHHQPETRNDMLIFPKADCIIHSTKLCGASVAWVLSHHLAESVARMSLDLAGIATIADQVPLLQANRSFAAHGLSAIQKSQRIGILELLQTMKVKQSEITEWNIGFGIAPRINAMGRMDHGLDALRLLCTSNKNQAQQLAAKLSETNTMRQDVTQEMKEDAFAQAEEQSDEKIIIVHSSEYHEGVIGLIAGELLQKYHKPAIAISEGSIESKASVRSVSGFNIVDFLRQIQEDFLSVGGHPMAAGFSFESKKLGSISEQLFALAQEQIDDKLLEKELSIECILDPSLLDLETVSIISQFAPFGMQNAQPLFLLEDMKVISKKQLGASGKHYKLFISAGNSSAETTEAVVWNKPHLVEQLESGDRISLVGNLQKNEWRGNVQLQLTLLDCRKD